MKIRANLKIVLLVSIILGLFLVQAHPEQYETANIPWSGYWWPYNSCGLATGNGYYGAPSPLEKYEQYTKGYYPSTLTNWYEDTYCSSDEYPSWYGHCGHWALAATWENYDILPSVLNNIVFRVGDKKGLLTLAHNNDEAISGSAADPVDFHYWLLQYIKEAQTAFVADMDGSNEVWQYPLYKYDMSSTISGNTESVTVTVYAASDGVDPDYIGTKDISFTLTYELYLNGSDEITGGEWTGDCADGDRPQKLYYCLSPNTSASGLDYDTVVEIAKSVDDEYENGEESVLLPLGTHNLILLDADLYELGCQTGDLLNLDISIVEGGGDDLTAVLTDNDGKVIKTLDVTSDDGADLELTADNPPYYLKVYKEDYETPGIYTLVFDRFNDNFMTCPYVPTDGSWSGFSIVNPSGDTLANLMITGYTEEGQPLQTLMGPEDMAARQRRRLLFSNLPYRAHELSSMNALRIIADGPVTAVNLIGTGSAVTAVGGGSGSTSRHLVLPDSVAEMQTNANMFGSVINESTDDAKVTLTLYSAAGASVKSVDLTLSPRQAYEFRSGGSPFYSVPEAGWFDISSTDESAVLSGYQYILRDDAVEINPAVPVSSDTMIVPHIPNATNWDTSLVLINTGSQDADVLLHRIMAGTDTAKDVSISLGAKARTELELNSLFGTTSDDKYYRSILSISSDQDLAGYYAYKAVGQDDNVTVPVMTSSDLSPILLLPHNTQSNDWWTGIGLVNPNADQVKISVKPYGSDKKLMSALIQTITLNSGEYAVYNIKKMFGSQVEEITFVRFEETSGNSIGGFYLIDSASQGICGGSLQVIEE